MIHQLIMRTPSFKIAHVAMSAVCRKLAAVTLFLCLVIQGHAAEKVFDEYQLKAVFLYRLTLFISWPDSAFTSSDQPFRIGIIGRDPFGSYLDFVVQNEKVGHRTIHVHRYHSIEEVRQSPCQALFISDSYDHQWPKLKKHLEPYHVLTVSDMAYFGQMGGMVNIRTQSNRVKIEVNPEEIRKAGLTISSKLIKVARQVATDDKGGRK